MRNWSPEAFDLAAGGATVIRTGGEEFAPLAAPRLDGEPGAGDRRFRREAGFADPSVIMASLSHQERALVCELVEQDVARAYAEREAALRAELAAAQQAELEALRAAQEAFAARWQQQDEQQRRELAAASARLAMQLAGKIVRGTAGRDPEVLARSLETVFYGAGARGALAVTVHPDDAAWLEDNPDLRRRLRIGDVVPDRRIAPGGCLVAADGREWDVTLQSQLDALSAVVEEWLTTAGRGSGAGEGHDQPLA